MESEKATGKTLSPEEYAKRHKDAFRCAFLFLNAHFPPGTEPEWWEGASRDVSAASESEGDNVLVMKLLAGVYDYLESEYKLRRSINETQTTE